MPRRSQEYMDGQRRRFCEAAMACFRRKGVAATNLTDICNQAALSMGALYKLFSNREELLEAVLKLRLDRRNELLRGSSWPELKDALLAYREELERNPFWREFQGIVDWSERLMAVRVREAHSILAQVEAQLVGYAAAGQIKPPFDLRRTAQLISVIFDGSMIEVRTSENLHVGQTDLADYLDLAVGAVTHATAEPQRATLSV